VPVGKQTISVHEYISDPWIKRKVGIQRAKDLEITIEPNKIYYIGAKFIRENRLKRKGELYWEPVVWKEKALNCDL